MDALKTAYRSVTRQIEVRAAPRFLADRSSPENGYFFWAYTITLTNLGRETVQGSARSITDPDEELAARRALAAKYEDWSAGKRLSSWARSALPLAVDMPPGAIADER